MTVAAQSVVLTTELPGRTSPCLIAEIRPQVNGLIQKRLFTEGSDIQAGQVLYQIDPAPFQAALDNAEANIVPLMQQDYRTGRAPHWMREHRRRQPAVCHIRTRPEPTASVLRDCL